MSMKNSILRLTLIIASATFAPSLCSAQVQYAYDSSGNRITRTISLTARRLKAATGIDDKVTLAAGHYVSFDQIADQNKLAVNITGLTGTDRCRLLICDLSGKQLHEQAVNATSTLVDFTSFHKGVYILSIELNGQKHSWKIQK